MFFFFGIMPVQKKLPYDLSGFCPRCGKLCKYTIIVSASCFSLFFIPIFKFSKKYIVNFECCENLYLLNKEIGKKIEAGEIVPITDNDLEPLDGNFTTYKTCPNCGYEIHDDFIHCPKCGIKL